MKFFDEVNYVEAMFSEDVGYYFVVHRKIHGDYTFQLLEVEKIDIDNETYAHFDFEGFKATEFTTYCYKGGPCGPACTYPRCCLDCNILWGPWPIACR